MKSTRTSSPAIRWRRHWEGRFMRRLASLLLGLVVAYPLSSCAVGHTIHREGLVTDSAQNQRFHRFSKPPGQSIVGYTTVDGIHHVVEGRAWIEGDSIVFERPAKVSGMEKPRPTMWKMVALTDLASVDAVEISAVRTVLFVASIAAVTYGVYVIGELAAWSASGPLLGGFGW